MRIIDAREITFGIDSDIRNAVIDFSEMTVSLVGLVSDRMVAGRPLIGYGFNSNGRYGQPGLLRERFFPRLRKAPAEELLTENGNIDPRAISDRIMMNEKPGGHGDRAVAVGVIDMAAWDLAAKVEGRPVAHTLAAQQGRRPQPDVRTYAAGGYYYPGKDIEQLQAEIDRYRPHPGWVWNTPPAWPRSCAEYNHGSMCRPGSGGTISA
ncbi:MAG TPA: hypothetical protein VHC49_12915 [Mycobacteriales bacterium]|nr:hypothetical protein [Mycobacteriales bacterium]